MKHRLELYAFLRAAILNHHDAEDLLQEVSMVVTRSWREYRAGTDFRAWVREIARRRVLEQFKKSKRHARFLEPDVLESLAEAAQWVEENRPIDARREALAFCLGRLNERLRQIIQLRYGENLEPGAIAARINKSTQAAYALLKRARTALRECVEGKTIPAESGVHDER
jgi:RNA polymerase sigma-70 factor (ECF subfamily)